MRGRWIRRGGAGLMLLGLLMLLFVAYQLWGTAFYTWQAQDHLRSELVQKLHRRLPTTAQVAAAGARGARPGGGLPPISTVPAGPMPAPAINAPIGLLAIPKIGLEDAIVEGVTEAQLEQGPGHYPGTPLPGERGNAAIAGHRTTYAHPFYNLNELAPGDPIYVLTAQGLFEYVVAEQFTVAPTDVSVVDDSSRQPTLTLTTCNPRYSAAQRLVVVANLFEGTSAPAGGRTEHTDPGAGSTVARHLGSAGAANRSTAAATGDALGGTANSPLPAVLWAVATLAAAIAVVLVRRRTPRRVRWLTSTAGFLGVLVVLFFFFEHLSLALPASF